MEPQAIYFVIKTAYDSFAVVEFQVQTSVESVILPELVRLHVKFRHFSEFIDIEK